MGGSKRPQGCPCRTLGIEPKRERDQDTMDIDVVQMHGLADKDTKEKQHTKGHCFLYNRQGHLKHNCPATNKDTIFKEKRNVPKVHIVQAESEKEAEPSMLEEVERLMTKLWGMLINVKDEVINALLNQEDF